MKALGLQPRAFICFSVFGYPDETLALVLEIVPEDFHLVYYSSEYWDWRGTGAANNYCLGSDSQSAFCTHSAVCSVYFVSGLQSAVCILY